MIQKGPDPNCIIFGKIVQKGPDPNCIIYKYSIFAKNYVIGLNETS